MLEDAATTPWPDAPPQLTGTREIDATAMVDYFAPWKVWLDRQNRDKPMGWPAASAAEATTP
jgi:peptidyl-dipeptidase A